MKKRKCELCEKDKAKRTCMVLEKFICSKCCADVRNDDCKECHHLKDTNKFHTSKPEKSKKKHFLIELNEELEEEVDNALALVEKGKIKQGRRIIEDLMEEHPGNHAVNYALGVVNSFEEHYDDALKYFTKAIDIYPYFLEAHFNKGITYQKQGNIKDTVKSFREVIEMGNAENEIVQTAKGFIKELEHLALQHEDMNLENYIAGQEKFDNAFSYMENGEWLKAIDGFNECLKVKKNHTQSYGNLGICYGQLGKKEEAFVMFDKALNIDPHYEPAITNKALFESLEEGETLTEDKLMSVNYYRDRNSEKTLKKKSYTKSM